MSIEPQLNNPAAATAAVPAIENEIPAYRAISPRAVVALILGVLSVLSFASWYFLVLAAAAVLLGFLADRQIQRFPDALTGRGMAQAGLGLGLMFGLTSVTVTSVQGLLRVNQAKAFARTYQNVLSKGTFAEAVWYGQHPSQRAESSPDEILKQLSQPGQTAAVFEERYAPIRAIKTALAEPKAEIHFLRVENHGDEELTPFAGVVYEVHTPEARNPAERERLALAVIKGAKAKNRALEWWVTDVVFPYKEKSFVAPPPEPKADDGHGHSH
ncbi:MAG: DUF4190 domain-containing protein [Planctomycetia bacterium]|nr:DUF4190 domain-containing protein [Planctomycetia bacterium]